MLVWNFSVASEKALSQAVAHEARLANFVGTRWVDRRFLRSQANDDEGWGIVCESSCANRPLERKNKKINVTGSLIVIGFRVMIYT